jgi:hypothetical protein
MNVDNILISNAVGVVLIDAAIQGYESAYKEERLGILLGTVDGNAAAVKRAKIYLGGDRTRAAADVNTNRFSQRVRELSKKSQIGIPRNIPYGQ